MFLFYFFISGLGDPAGPGLTIKTGRASGRGSPPSQGPGSPAGGLTTPGGKKDRVPNHWWELELTAEGPMLYPTSNCHEWTSDNGIEHRIMEIEFQHGCEVCVYGTGALCGLPLVRGAAAAAALDCRCLSTCCLEHAVPWLLLHRAVGTSLTSGGGFFVFRSQPDTDESTRCPWVRRGMRSRPADRLPLP